MYKVKEGILENSCSQPLTLPMIPSPSREFQLSEMRSIIIFQECLFYLFDISIHKTRNASVAIQAPSITSPDQYQPISQSGLKSKLYIR